MLKGAKCECGGYFEINELIVKAKFVKSMERDEIIFCNGRLFSNLISSADAKWFCFQSEILLGVIKRIFLLKIRYTFSSSSFDFALESESVFVTTKIW